MVTGVKSGLFDPLSQSMCCCTSSEYRIVAKTTSYNLDYSFYLCFASSSCKLLQSNKKHRWLCLLSLIPHLSMLFLYHHHSNNSELFSLSTCFLGQQWVRVELLWYWFFIRSQDVLTFEDIHIHRNIILDQ